MTNFRSPFARQYFTLTAPLAISILIGTLGAAISVHAQSVTPAPPDPSSELRRQEERTQALRQREEAVVDVKSPALVLDATRLPSSESPCFRIDQLVIGQSSAAAPGASAPVHPGTDFAWLTETLTGPQHDDSPLRKCLGAKGIALVLKRAQDALLQRGFVTSRILAQEQDLSSGTLAFNEGTSKFGLWSLDAGASVPFKVLDKSLRYNAALHVQDNSPPLTPQDRLAIGGRFTVRGFDGESSLASERGWTLRNDFSVALGGSGQEAYLGLDAGEVNGPSAQRLLGNTLSGGVVGLRGSFKVSKSQWHYDLFVGAPLYHPNGFKSAQTTAGFSLTAEL